MKRTKPLFLLILGIALTSLVYSQTVQISIEIATGADGYECYWELLPVGNACGNSPIATGGNLAEMGCGTGGNQNATFGNGYANNATITEGPFTLTVGTQYDIWYEDDWGDGGATFEVQENCGYVTNWVPSGTHVSGKFTFTAAAGRTDDLGISDMFYNMLNDPPNLADTAGMMYYTQITQNQAVNNPINFSALVDNHGQSNGANVRLYASVTGAGTYSDSSAAATINACASDYLQITNSAFAPFVQGTYNIDLRVGMTATDVYPDNDSITAGAIAVTTFDVSDTVWARDVNQVLGSFYFGPGQLYRVGNLFTVSVQDTATTISCHLANSNVAGNSVRFHIWDGSLSTPTVLASSDFYGLAAGDIGNWVTLPFTSGTILDGNNNAILPSGDYVVGVETFDDPTYISKGQLSGYPFGIVVCDPNQFGSWYNVSTGIPKVRLNMGSRYIIIGTEEQRMETAVSVYPNPSNGQFTLQFDQAAADDYGIALKNILGQVIYTEEIAISGNYSKQLNLTSLEKGVYFLYISNTDETTTRKLIIE